MSSFIVSARKYRPETFKSVLGQDVITSTLKNAIKSNHIGHAYLFSGPRGIGKTTCARIFAKTINCSNLTSEYEPCNACESCNAFNNSRSFNIHELDAASNNSVDDIRLLIEKVRVPPQIGKFSVYIIDEVHMLSTPAFNAFLKTLEEPPVHAIFILATTEKHKIIPTILSRCQIFDFNRIKLNDIVNFLAYIANNENINYEPEALHIIAQKADGAMRDALSIFDQIVSFSGKTIKYQHVIDNLSILDYEYYFRITNDFLAGNTSNAFLLLNEILNEGFDAQNFISGLGSHFRDLLVSKDPETVKLLEVSENFKEKYLKQSEQCSDDFLYSALNICSETDLKYKMSRNQRLLVELAILKLSRILEEKKKPSPEQLNDLSESDISGKHKESDREVRKEPATYMKQEGNNISSKNAGIKKNLIKSPAISIRNIVSSFDNREEDQAVPADTEDEEELEETISESDFSQEDLLFKWNEYADNIHSERPRISAILKNRMPVLGDGFQLSLSLDNAAQKEEFDNNIKKGLLKFLKKELNNSFIQIITLLEKEENKKKILYTPEERFQYLSRKNPVLNKLKQQFNLDFE